VLTQDPTDVLRKKNIVNVLKIIIAKSLLNSTKIKFQHKLKILVIAASARRNRKEWISETYLLVPYYRTVFDILVIPNNILNFRTASKISKSLRSNIVWRFCGSVNFLEWKAKGYNLTSLTCRRAAPVAASEASVCNISLEQATG